MTTILGPVTIAPMTQAQAEAIARWRYEPPYDFYDLDADERDLAELLDPESRGDGYFAACGQAGEVIGFLQLRNEGDAIVIGLGLRPDLTDRGLGGSFLEAGLGFARKAFAPLRFRVRVAEFNRRAITVYERAGFVRTRAFLHETNGGRFRFVEMERSA